MEKTVEIKKEEKIEDGTHCLTQEEVDELVESIKKEQLKKAA